MSSCQAPEFVRFHKCMCDFLTNMIALCHSNNDPDLASKFNQKLELMNAAQQLNLNFTGIRFHQELSKFENDINNEDAIVFTKLSDMQFEGLEDIKWEEVYQRHLDINNAAEPEKPCRQENCKIVCQYLKMLLHMSKKCIDCVNRNIDGPQQA